MTQSIPGSPPVTSRPAAKPIGAARKSTARYVSYDKITHDAAGNVCVTTGYRKVNPGQDPAILGIDDTSFGPILAVYERCPTPTRAANALLPSTPTEFAVDFWQDIPLPEPEPHIAPGRAITGLRAFLETNGSTDAAFSMSTPLGPMEIVATGTYDVDWGDGTHGGPFAFEGDPWPDGTITHEYQRVGNVDVVVTESWVATWRLGAETGILRELRTTATIADFPVQQIQAVVGR